jgi:hypothetical protein
MPKDAESNLRINVFERKKIVGDKGSFAKPS